MVQRVHEVGYLRIVVRLSNITTVRGFQFNRTWKSCPLIMWSTRNLMRSSLSSIFMPWILVMNSLLTKSARSPVTGCTRTRGWALVTGSFRTWPPASLANPIIFSDVWRARSSSIIARNVGESRLKIPKQSRVSNAEHEPPRCRWLDSELNWERTSTSGRGKKTLTCMLLCMMQKPCHHLRLECWHCTKGRILEVDARSSRRDARV